MIDASVENPIDIVKKETQKRGADFVIEAAGSILAYSQAFEMVRRGGRILAFGASPANETMQVKPFDIYSKELTIVGSYAGTYHTWIQAINLLASGKFDPGEIITDRIKLFDVVDGIESIRNNRKKLKIMILE